MEFSVVVNVVILDINDNLLYFLSVSYKIDVIDKMLVGMIVLIIVVEDKDIYDNGCIMYFIVGVKEDLFSIDLDDGFIK